MPRQLTEEAAIAIARDTYCDDELEIDDDPKTSIGDGGMWVAAWVWGGRRGGRMNGYICFYRGKQYEVHADTSYDAQQKCAKENRIKKTYEITVVLAEKDGEQVTHTADF